MNNKRKMKKIIIMILLRSGWMDGWMGERETGRRQTGNSDLWFECLTKI
jgi:hypothetical protein